MNGPRDRRAFCRPTPTHIAALKPSANRRCERRTPWRAKTLARTAAPRTPPTSRIALLVRYRGVVDEALNDGASLNDSAGDQIEAEDIWRRSSPGGSAPRRMKSWLAAMPPGRTGH
jgi:hypothetical protein